MFCGVQVVYPGAYRCVCVQIKLHHMAVNATAQAGVIGELEGAALLDSSLDPQGAGPAFKVLKQLVSNWLHDAVQHHNRCVKPDFGCSRFDGLQASRSTCSSANAAMRMLCCGTFGGGCVAPVPSWQVRLLDIRWQASYAKCLRVWLPRCASSVRLL